MSQLKLRPPENLVLSERLKGGGFAGHFERGTVKGEPQRLKPRWCWN